MGKFSLQTAFFVLGFSFMLLKINEMVSLGTPLVFAVSLLLPAAALGALAWWSVDSFARRWPVVLCVAMSSVGFFTTGLAENRRGIAAATFLILVLPIAALIVRHRCWWLCAKTYVLSITAALVWAFWLEYRLHGISLFFSTHRFGFLWNMQNGMRMANPNVIGIQLAFAAVVAFAIYLKETERSATNPGSTRHTGWLMLGCLTLLAMGCMLTASRGAFVAMFAGLATLLMWGTKAQAPGRLRGLAVTLCVLVSLAVFMVGASDFKPWRALGKRFGSTQGVLTASGRVGLWVNAYNTWKSDPRLFWIGTGTGAAPDVLSLRNRYIMPDGMSIRALDTHNAFCEWMVSYGIIGLAAGAVMMFSIVRRAFQLDRRDGRVTRRAILLCFFLTSMNLVTFYDLFFVAAGSLVLAMLSESPASEAGVPACQQQATAIPDCQSQPPQSSAWAPATSGRQGCLPHFGFPTGS